MSLPLDLIFLILEPLVDSRCDLLACSLVNKNFHRAAIPLFYSLLDARMVREHLAISLLRHSDLAKYVRHLTERGAITQDTLNALSLCTNLASLTWIDDIPSSPCLQSVADGDRNPDTETLALIALAQRLPRLSSLTLRTYNDLSPEAWSKLASISGLRRLSLWCFSSPHFLTGNWISGPLAESLTHLELCVGAIGCAECLSLFSGLVSLQELRLKGAPASIIPTILALLPNLHTLDTDFVARRQPTNVEHCEPTATLGHLTVRTSSCSPDTPTQLYAWIKQLGGPTKSFTLHAFTVRVPHIVPSAFFRSLASTLKEFMVGEAQVGLADVQFCCESMPGLERIECQVEAPDVSTLRKAVDTGKRLRRVKFRVRWTGLTGKLCLEQAREWMLCHDQLRVIGVDSVVFKVRSSVAVRALPMQ
ncbi:hypothetical protein C8F01DRAFT_1105067 [Mycena amicta]|nr:hypothetical protein C8F01DRAFT_1105067 [Mycena amicta]